MVIDIDKELKSIRSAPNNEHLAGELTAAICDGIPEWGIFFHLRYWMNQRIQNYFKNYTLQIWGISDIYDVAQKNCYPMSDSLAREILAQVDHNQNAEYGISWDTLENALETRLRGEDFSAFTYEEMEGVRGNWILELNKLETESFDFEIFKDTDLSTVVLKARLWAIEGDVEIYCANEDIIDDLDPSENAGMFSAMDESRVLLKVTSKGDLFQWQK